MSKIGGKGYYWKGKSIRITELKGVSCVSLPRKDSVISVRCKDLSPNQYYRLTVNALGNGKIIAELDKKNTYVLSIISAGFKKFECVVNTNLLNKNNILSIYKHPSNHNNVYIDSIVYENIPCPKTQKEKELEQAAALLQKKQREQELKRTFYNQIQNEKAQLLQKEFVESLQVASGDKMGNEIFIGGSNYRWKGKDIRSFVDKNSVFVSLQRPGSMVLAPVKIAPNAWFKIDLYGKLTSKGNGVCLANFFGGKKTDGAQTQITIASSALGHLSFNLKSPNFSPSIPINLRIWRPHNATGTINIKEIKITQIKNLPEKVKKTEAKIASIQKKINKKIALEKTQIRENFDMKFKPYSINNAISDAKEVLISDVSMVPKVSIITPTRDGLTVLKKCYEALNANTSYPHWEWIVGDSNSTDGTSEYMKSLSDPRIKFVERNTTSGSFSTINNDLTAFATGEYYLFLNNDTEPQPFWLDHMMSKIHRHPEIGIVGARLMYNAQKTQHAGIMFIPNGPINVGKPVVSALGGESFFIHDRFYQAVTGACLLIRASDFKKIGGFDPIYYFCYEDVDLCLKVKYNLEKKILYSAKAIVYHAESVTQNKYKTSGPLQKIGIEEFKKRWMNKVEIDFDKYAKSREKGIYRVDISFITCVNNLKQYTNFVIGSLFMNNTMKNYEFIPILNVGNMYSAAGALNIGITQSRGSILVLSHQDVLFYKHWVELLYKRIAEIEQKTKKWGVLGTAGITAKKDTTVGAVYNLKGKLQWRQNVRATVWPVQTVDEHCMIINSSSGLKFDEKTFYGFHCYGPDIALNALSKGFKNYGILCPLIHDSSSGSLKKGQADFMKWLKALSNKWKDRFSEIRTTTSKIVDGKVRTFIKF